MNAARAATGSLRAWIIAARPPTLWAAVAPVVVGGAIAIDDGVWRCDVFVVVLVAAVAIQIGVNFANDVADAATGADGAGRIGPVRAVASGLIPPLRMWRGVAAAFAVATLGGVYLIWQAGPIVLVIGVASIIAALGYTAGPFPYGYRGYGEVFVFVFFGLVATVGTRFVFDRTAPPSAWFAGIAMGLLASAILVANNYRDIDSDAAVGKRTLAVRTGRRATRALYAATIVGGVVVCPVAALAGSMPGGAAIAGLALPLTGPLIRTITRTTAGPPLIGLLKATARLQILVAALLAVGIVALPG